VTFICCREGWSHTDDHDQTDKATWCVLGSMCLLILSRYLVSTNYDRTFFLSLGFNGHFPGKPGLAGFIGAKMMEVVVTTESVQCAKLQW